MSFINTILVPVDLSACSGAALRYAAYLAEHNGASLNVLHVVEQGLQNEPSEAALSPRRADKRARLEALVGEALGGQVQSVHVSIKAGEPAQCILQAAQAQGADVIVMGKYGDRPYDASQPGNVLDSVAAQATCGIVPVFEPSHDGSAFALAPSALQSKTVKSGGHTPGKASGRARNEASHQDKGAHIPQH